MQYDLKAYTLSNYIIAKEQLVIISSSFVAFTMEVGKKISNEKVASLANMKNTSNISQGRSILSQQH